MKTPSAAEALDILKEGNLRNQTGEALGEGRDRARRRELLSSQQPYAVILSCSDSRVVPEIIFDAGIGDLFVIRVAGNVANTSTIATIEYAVAHLGTKLVVVLAHESCGAVTAAIKGVLPSDNLGHLLSHIRSAIRTTADSNVDATARRNAQLTAERLASESNIIGRAVNTDGLVVMTAFYHLESGAVDFA